MTATLLTDTRFRDLPLDSKLLDGTKDAGFDHCTPIQARALPVALAGRDVAGQAQTGTGKTAAYLLATFHRLLTQSPSPERRSTDPRAIILAPTRELAVQIAKDAELLGAHTGLTLGLVFGGADYEGQRRMLERGVDVLVGTPGRLIDYFKQRIFSLRAVQVVVLDEADRMFDLGFIRDIRYLLRRMPPHDKRLGLMFSATLSHRVLELAYEHMNDPESVRIDPENITAEGVRQLIYFPANAEKLPLLVGLLRRMHATRTMIFVNTKREAERLGRYLDANGFHAEAISGDVPQKKRLKMLSAFHSGSLPILIGTDVASRGLHIPGVSHVINYDLSQDAEDYVHRIGRTARLGAVGDAISFGCEQYVTSLPDIEDLIGYKIPVAAIEPDLLVEITRPPMRPRSDRESHRPRRPHRGGRQRKSDPGKKRR